jgi:glycerol-3-phosphate dehydrogenase (NAD(P)+)
MNPPRVCIVGNGGWGTALGLLLRSHGGAVTLWGPFEEDLRDIRAAGENRKFLPGVPLPADLRWTSDPAEAARDADLVVLATPSHFFPEVCERFRLFLPARADVVSVAKGLCEHSHRRLSEIAAEQFGRPDVAALSGPSHAEEVARGIPTAVVVAACDPGLAERLQQRFAGPRFRVYTSDDPVGVELGGAVKNVIALAVGISDGLGFGDNTRAALITRGLAELSRLGVALGAHPETFAGLSGMGDLVVTCTSRHSRNRRVGERLGRGEPLAAIRQGMAQVAEGVWNCPIALALAAEHGVDLPISGQVQAVLDGTVAPADAVAALMERDAKPERSIPPAP